MLENGKTLPGHKLQSTLWKWRNRKQNPHLIQNRNRKKYPKTHMEPQKTPIAKAAPEQKRQCQRDYNSRLQNILQSHNHKNNMVLAENLRFHLTVVRTAKINWTTHNKCWRRCGEREPSCIVDGIENWYSHFQNHHGKLSEAADKSTL